MQRLATMPSGEIDPTRFRAVALVCLLAGLVACAPAQNVKPLPNFVETAIEPGDKVIVTTVDGETSEFVVTEVRDETLFGDDHRIPISDIATLQKRSWSRPASPCGGQKPLGCSVPIAISIASESHEYYREKFYDACAQHDYCYRHGYRSYGLDRETCDTEFLENMRAICPEEAGNVVTRTFQLMDDSVESRQTCLAVANSFYVGVRRYGEDKFEIEGSTYCEYDGPP
ncbi:MAG: hypothetical protein PVG91_09380 [Gammaproteobacteria bacterium]|jgi:hypothetical protein